MRICVLGLWHLGSVTAAGLASLGHQVTGLDFDEARIAQLSAGAAPLYEPGLEQLIRQGLSSGSLRFTSNLAEATRDIEVLWAACDTPLEEAATAGTEWVLAQIERVLPALRADTIVLVSSQVPVGTVRRLEWAADLDGPGAPVRLAYSPENLRLGSAVDDFLHPGRIVVGVRSERDKPLLQQLLASICKSIEWMTVESAEMSKHAINAFLATSVSFANELASICESVGADAKEVERALKSDRRIGPGAYLSPGAAFAGGTLARDVAFLNRTAREHGVNTPLLFGVLPSNDAHKGWAQQRLRSLFPDLSQVTVAVWGLAYKAGTDTLRDSMSVGLCDWMLGEGARVHVHDPAVTDLPGRWAAAVQRHDDPLATVRGAQALIVATDAPLYRVISREQLLQVADPLVVLDANHLLSHLAGTNSSLRYFAVGRPIEDFSV